MEQDIILVTVQYRLNLFGFLSTEDSSAPGNYGMLDQVEALKWVQTHISSYGGDPDQVTILGMSAGGASVHYLTLSPLSRHLYKNAISLSGSALCWWANVPHQNKNAVTLGDHFGCPMTSSKVRLPMICNNFFIQIILYFWSHIAYCIQN
jgi:carboxylesterase type B